jgi:hypothetical protein
VAGFPRAHSRVGYPAWVRVLLSQVPVAFKRGHCFDQTGIPNAIFFAHVLARAATRNGVQVDGYQMDGGGIPSG